MIDSPGWNAAWDGCNKPPAPQSSLATLPGSGFEKQRAIFNLEAANENLHMWIIRGPVQGIREASLINQQELAGSGVVDCVINPVTVQGFLGCGLFPDRPTGHQIDGVVDDGHQVGFAAVLNIMEFGEESIGHLEQVNGFQPSQPFLVADNGTLLVKGLWILSHKGLFQQLIVLGWIP